MMKNNQKGFTLVEIMIALVIGIFLTSGVIKIFLNTKQSNRMQENLSRMQENARFAMSFISEDIRKADYWGGDCVEGVIGSANNHLDTGHSEYDAAKHVFNNVMDDSVSGAEGTAHATNTALDSSDTISVKGFFNAGGGSQIDSVSGADIKVNSNSGFKQYDVALITNCSVADIFQVTNSNVTADATGDILNSAIGGASVSGNAPGNSSVITQTYTNEHRVFNISGDTTRTYSIDPVSIALQRGSNDLVDDIENMQIIYGVETGTGSIYYAPWSAAMNMENVVSVEVSLLVRSAEDNLTTTAQSFFYNGATATATDRRLRKVYTSRIAVRNRLP